MTGSEPSRAEPGSMGCKQGVRGALLEAAGLSLPAAPRGTSGSATLLQFITENSSRLNERASQEENADQLVTSCTSTVRLRASTKLRPTHALAASQRRQQISGGLWGARTKLLPSCRSSGHLTGCGGFNLVSGGKTRGPPALQGPITGRFSPLSCSSHAVLFKTHCTEMNSGLPEHRNHIS